MSLMTAVLRVLDDDRATLSTWSRSTAIRAGLVTRARVVLAALLLMRPQVAVGIRAAAVALGRAPSSVSEGMSRLRYAGLVEQGNRLVVPDLFQAFARRRHPESVDVAALPAPRQDRVDWMSRAKAEWPLVHPLWVALDLARDPGRGAEALAAWDPPGRWQRVW